jgi:hypothetical protein
MYGVASNETAYENWKKCLRNSGTMIKLQNVIKILHASFFQTEFPREKMGDV